MILFTTFLYFLFSVCSARPDLNNQLRNVVSVPTNCQEGQQWYNGGCRDVWRVPAAPANLVTVPTNCPTGQEYVNGQCRDVKLTQNTIGVGRPRPDLNNQLRYVIEVPKNCKEGQEWYNGECRDVWRVPAAPANVVTVPTNCPTGQEYVNGQCRDIWLTQNTIGVGRPRPDLNNQLRYVIEVPKNCKEGQEWYNGECRDVWRVPAAPANVVTVPTNCPTGQEYVNGQCRDIWLTQNTIGVGSPRPDLNNQLRYVIEVPKNCKEGQEWYNGECRDVWRVPAAPANLVTVPRNCPTGQEYVNGQCRDMWLTQNTIGVGSPRLDLNNQLRNVVSVPTNCPEGQQWYNGGCRDVWRVPAAPANVVTVPTNCPTGQEYVNGQCRDIWLTQNTIGSPNSIENYIDNLKNLLLRKEREEVEDSAKYIVSVPSQCPDGYRPDALGICRKILNM